MHRYPQFNLFRALTYPLALSSIMMILLTGYLISASLQNLFLLIISSAATGLFSLWFLKYLFMMMTQTAIGDPVCPVLNHTLIRPFEDLRHLKLLLLLLGHITLMAALAEFSPALGLVYLAGFVALLPAMILVLGGDNSLLKTAHLPLLWQIVKNSGALYWLVFGFYLACAGFILYLFERGTTLFLVVIAVLYLLMVAFHLLGVILYTRREELGYQAHFTPEREQQRKHHLQVADMLYRQQCRPAALASADKLLASESIEVYDFLLDEILTWDNPRFLLRYIEHYLAVYLDSTQFLKGLSRYESLLNDYPELRDINDELYAGLNHKLAEMEQEFSGSAQIRHFRELLNNRTG